MAKRSRKKAVKRGKARSKVERSKAAKQGWAVRKLKALGSTKKDVAELIHEFETLMAQFPDMSDAAKDAALSILLKNVYTETLGGKEQERDLYIHRRLVEAEQSGMLGEYERLVYLFADQYDLDPREVWRIGLGYIGAA